VTPEAIPKLALKFKVLTYFMKVYRFFHPLWKHIPSLRQAYCLANTKSGTQGLIGWLI